MKWRDASNEMPKYPVQFAVFIHKEGWIGCGEVVDHLKWIRWGDDSSSETCVSQDDITYWCDANELPKPHTKKNKLPYSLGEMDRGIFTCSFCKNNFAYDWYITFDDKTFICLDCEEKDE